MGTVQGGEEIMGGQRRNFKNFDDLDGLKIMTVNIPMRYRAYIIKLIKMGLEPSISEYIRKAVKNQISMDTRTLEYMDKLLGMQPKTQEQQDNEFLKSNGIKVIRRLEY